MQRPSEEAEDEAGAARLEDGEDEEAGAGAGGRQRKRSRLRRAEEGGGGGDGEAGEGLEDLEDGEQVRVCGVFDVCGLAVRWKGRKAAPVHVAVPADFTKALFLRVPYLSVWGGMLTCRRPSLPLCLRDAVLPS